jgi:hypothetical protein
MSKALTITTVVVISIIVSMIALAEKVPVVTPVVTPVTAIMPPSRPAALVGKEPVCNLGKFGIAPWGSKAKFIDLTAEYSWNTSTAQKTAPATTILLQAQYFNIGSTPMTVTLHTIVDNNAEIRLNGSKQAQVIGGWTDANYPKIMLQLKPGNNIIDVIAYNGGIGAAGLLMSLIDSTGRVLLNTNKETWVSQGTVPSIEWK